MFKNVLYYFLKLKFMKIFLIWIYEYIMESTKYTMKYQLSKQN